MMKMYVLKGNEVIVRFKGNSLPRGLPHNWDVGAMIDNDTGRAEFGNAKVEFLPGWLRLTFVYKEQTRTISFPSEVIDSVQTAPETE